MTPAIKLAEKAGIRFRLHEYTHDPAAASYGLEAAQLLGVESARVFKTLLVEAHSGQFPRGKQLAVGVVPVSGELDLKAIARALNGKKAEMADPHEAEKATGYLVGGISPLGQKKRLPLVLDSSATGFETIYVSGGRRGLEIELSAADLIRLTSGKLAPIAAPD